MDDVVVTRGVVILNVTGYVVCLCSEASIIVDGIYSQMSSSYILIETSFESKISVRFSMH